MASSPAFCHATREGALCSPYICQLDTIHLFRRNLKASLCRSIYLANDRMNVPTHLRACPDESMPGDQSISSPWVDLLGLNSMGSSCFIWISFATGLMNTWEES